MRKPALRKNRYKKESFLETKWTKSSNSLGEYIFRRLSLDQSDKRLQNIRPRHMLSKLIISSKEINNYVNDYLAMLDKNRVDSFHLNDKKKTISNYSHDHNNISYS